MLEDIKAIEVEDVWLEVFNQTCLDLDQDRHLYSVNMKCWLCF